MSGVWLRQRYAVLCCPPLLLTAAAAGMLDKYGVELIGAKLPSIDRAEDRELFKQAMQRIGLKTPPRYAGL
jgi:carbamoyl-phosphate synthase large subunit